MDCKQIAILYDKYYDFASKQILIGGIQTYISNLAELSRQMEYQVSIYQMGYSQQSVTINGCRITELSIKKSNKQSFSNQVAKLCNTDLAIYATEGIVPRRIPFKKAIAIQHGIYWDMPSEKKHGIWYELLTNSIRSYLIHRRIRNMKTVVCVDYNFINWIRTQNHSLTAHLEAVPNYTPIANKVEKTVDTINIIFARRLYWYRGTRVFTQAIIPILEKHPNVHVTIAGDGPDRAYMHNMLKKYLNVEFTTYQSDESLKIHADKHIAVVPTVGSEGTSLALLEAMSSQCAVIASNVGGMTNIILNGYNGLMVNAGDAASLTQALERLVSDTVLRKKIADNGYETVKEAFSLRRWQNQWRRIINQQVNNE